jgi:predicted Zn finger-like uncharacterized protein
MVMVVQCKFCMTEYRLDEALLKGAKGACIRCPTCRERIIVENPRASQVAPPIPHPVTLPTAPPIGHMVPPPSTPSVPPRVVPPAAIETAFPRILLEAPGGMISPVPRYRRADEADLSGRIQPDPPGVPGGKAMRLEELFIHPSAVEGDRIPDEGEDGPVVIRSPGPGWNPPPRRPLYRRPLFLAVAISILLLAGGTFYFLDGNSDRKSSDSIIPVRARSTPERPVFDVGNLKGSLNKQASGEPLYVVKGTVTNVGKALSSGIRIEATLLGKDNQAIVKSGTFAGNVIDESLIPHMTRVRIEGFLGMRYGEGYVNRNIPAGKTLPFMVVFFDPPEGIESFAVNAMNAEETERIRSQDAKESGTRASYHQAIRMN